MTVELTPEQVDRLMLAIEKIDELSAMFDPAPLPRERKPRVITRYTERPLGSPPDPAELAALIVKTAASIERRLLLWDVVIGQQQPRWANEGIGL